MQLYLMTGNREGPPPDLLNPPMWVQYVLEGYSRPAAHLLATRDVLVECGRYVRQGRSRELMGLLWTKLRRRLRRKARLCCAHSRELGRDQKPFDFNGGPAGYHEYCAGCGILLRTVSAQS